MTPAAAPDTATPEAFQRLGLLTRQLHDALTQLGVMGRLQQSAGGLPDARSRLAYIVRKSGEAADRVLNAVEAAQQQQAAIADAARRLPAGEAAAASAITAAAQRTGEQLTDIMLAQDFHDLTGQVVARVVALAIDLEDSLVKLLLQSAPAEPAAAAPGLAGPQIDAGARSDVVADQREVDELLAGLGF